MKNSQKGFVIPLIIVIVAILAVGGAYYAGTKKAVQAPGVPEIINNVPTSTPIVGGDRDVHGCIGSAGYSWCAAKNKCLRVWEEKCEVPSVSTTTIKPIACTMDAKMCPDGTYVGRTGPNCEFVCPVVASDAPPPLGNSTIKLFCNSEGCNTSGVKSTRSDFYVTVDGTKVKVLIDIETRLRYVHGGDSDTPGNFEDIVKWVDFYPMIDGPVMGGVPFSATIYGDWIDPVTFKANWIKWSIG